MSKERSDAAKRSLDRRVGRLRWKKLQRETGLRAVGAGPRGSVLHDGEREYGWVYALGGGWRGPVRGWYFVCPEDAVGEYANTCHNPVPDEATAKAQATEFVKARLKTPNTEIKGERT